MINKNKNRKAAWITALLLLIMLGVIFGFSSQEGTESAALSKKIASFVLEKLFPSVEDMCRSDKNAIISRMTFLVRKTAHFCEYALMAALMCLHINFALGKLRIPLAVSFGFLYACSDELHQKFTAGRACRFTDVLIDTSGAITGAAVMLLLIWMIKQIRKNKAEALLLKTAAEAPAAGAEEQTDKPDEAAVEEQGDKSAEVSAEEQNEKATGEPLQEEKPVESTAPENAPDRPLTQDNEKTQE